MTRLAFEGGWSLELPDSFKRTEREGGLDATDGVRTIHVASISIGPKTAGSRPPPARELHAFRKPARTAYELAGPDDWGWAVIDEDTEDRHLEATREAEGTILTCWVSYPNERDREWALSVWRAAQWSPSDS
jgi:hypothetical protein